MSNENEWFPEGYEAPVDVSAFMKLQDGDNTFRVLSPAVTGWEYWSEDNKPVRSKTKFEETPGIRSNNGKPTVPKHFWTFLVWNYKTESVQSLEITQATVMKAIKALVENPKWNSPLGYDITINKTGKELLTKYNVVPNPHSPLTPEQEEALKNTEIDLEAIFEN